MFLSLFGTFLTEMNQFYLMFGFYFVLFVYDGVRGAWKNEFFFSYILHCFKQSIMNLIYIYILACNHMYVPRNLFKNKINQLDHLASYQFLPIFASTYRLIFNLWWRGFYINFTTCFIACFAVEVGPSKITSSWTWSNNFHPNSLSFLSFQILTIAPITQSAAPPYIGVLIAARSPWDFWVDVEIKCLVKSRYLPINVWVHPLSKAIFFILSCHYFTSIRSEYHF